MATTKGFFERLSDSMNGNNIKRAKIVGVRTAEQTKVLNTYNFGIYSVLVEYDDCTVRLIEAELGSTTMDKILKHIEW